MSDSELNRNTDELARRGAEVFDQKVRPLLRPEADGKFVAVDLGTGEYEVDENDYAAVMRLRARRPAAEVWLMRAGYATAYQMRFGRIAVVPGGSVEITPTLIVPITSPAPPVPRPSRAWRRARCNG